MEGQTDRIEKGFEWIQQKPERMIVLKSFLQPMTITQIVKKSNLTLDTCRYVIWELATRGIVECLTPLTKRNHIYWLTKAGRLCREKISMPIELTIECNWDLYSWACFSQRSIVIQAITKPLHPRKIRIRACERDPTIKLSTANTRDVLRVLLERKIVQKVQLPKERYPRYKITEVGLPIQTLLRNLKWHL